MITQVAIIVMLLYAVGVGVLNRILHKVVPPVSQKYVSLWVRPWLALFWLWGPAFWFVPGLVWFRVLNVPQTMRLTLIAVSFFLPLSIFVFFLSLLNLFPFRSDNPLDKIISYLAVGFVGIITLYFISVLMLSPQLTAWKSFFLIFTVALHPCLSILTLSDVARKIIPCPSDNALTQLGNSLKMVVSFFSSFPKPAWVVQQGTLKTRVPGDATFGSGPGWLVTEPENVVVLDNGYNLTRIEPPGVILTVNTESPYKVVDLRNQHRAMDIIAVTRDGIEVTVNVSFSFRIDSGPQRPHLRNPWPIHRRDIYQAVFAEVVDPDGRTPLDNHLAHPWEDLPLKIAAYKVKQVVGFYSLFELYEDGTSSEIQMIHKRAAAALQVNLSEESAHQLTRKVIGKLVLESVSQMLKSHGFHVYDGGIQKSIVPVSKELTGQRVEAWKTRWISKVMHWQAETQTGNIDALEQLEMGAALASVDELIQDLSRRVNAAGNNMSKQALAGILVSDLLDLAHIPEVATLLPDTLIPKLHVLQQEFAEE